MVICIEVDIKEKYCGKLNNMIQEKSILICRLIKKPEILNSEGMLITHNPIDCFTKALSVNPGLILIIFSARIVSMQDQVIELCSCFKDNPITKEIPILVLMEILHRDLIVKLQKARVAAIEIYRPNVSIDLRNMATRALNNEPFLNINQLLKKLCPSLNSIKIDNQRDLTVCRAYGNRMVLGGERLHEICETSNHLHCDYFLNSRLIQ